MQRHLRLARYILKQDRVRMSIDQSFKNRPAARDALRMQSTDGVTTHHRTTTSQYNHETGLARTLAGKLGLTD